MIGPAATAGSTGADPLPRAARVTGVDVARGAALLGMMAAHLFDRTDEHGAPTVATLVVAGRSAATFVLIAGVSLALMSGGSRVVTGPGRSAVAGGLVVRALLIGTIGLALGLLGEFHGVDGILPFYAVLFLLAVPLLGLPPLVLSGVAAAVIIAGPVLLVSTAQGWVPYGSDEEASFVTLVQDPLGLLVQLFVTGEYPVTVYLAYICAGLAVGRLDLTARRVGCWLLGAGVALAVVARLASALVLYPLGGLAALISQDASGDTTAEAARTLLWQPDAATSWWYLALPAPHSNTPVDLVHTLGSALAVLGAALLLTRLPVMARVLAPLAAAGSMALTLYSAHLVFLATGILDDQPGALYLLMVLAAIAFALLWRRRFGQGPLERMVAVVVGATRRRLADRLAPRPSTATADGRAEAVPRGTAARAGQFLFPVVSAAVLVLAFGPGTRFGPDREEALASSGGAEPARSEPAPSEPARTKPDRSEPARSEAGVAPDLDRYCLLSEQVGDVEDQHPDDPAAVVGQAGLLLADMPRVAPMEIRDAVHILVTHLRAEAGDRAVQAPDEPALERAEETIDAFEEEHCP